MATYIMTFGQKYHREEHPTLGEAAHPDGWVTIEAEDEDEARDIAFEHTDGAFAFIYAEEHFKSHYHPRGELLRLPHHIPNELGKTGETT